MPGFGLAAAAMRLPSGPLCGRLPASAGPLTAPHKRHVSPTRFTAPPPPTHLRRMGVDRGPPPPGTAWADAPPGEGAIRMEQQYHCHTQCYAFGAAAGVMSSGKPPQSQDPQTWSCGLVARPRPRASCLGLCTPAPGSPTPWHIVGPAVAAAAGGGAQILHRLLCVGPLVPPFRTMN